MRSDRRRISRLQYKTCRRDDAKARPGVPSADGDSEKLLNLRPPVISSNNGPARGPENCDIKIIPRPAAVPYRLSRRCIRYSSPCLKRLISRRYFRVGGAWVGGVFANLFGGGCGAALPGFKKKKRDEKCLLHHR